MRSTAAAAAALLRMVGAIPPVLEDIAIYGGFFIAGDICAQKITDVRDNFSGSMDSMGSTTKELVRAFKRDVKYDKKHIEFTTVWGVIGGYAVHKWYKFLDGNFKNIYYGYSHKPMISGILNRIPWSVRIHPVMAVPMGLLVCKAIVDVVFDAPLYGAYIYMQKAYTKGMEMKGFFKEFSNMYAVDVLFWIPVNLLNFFLVKPKYRVPVVSAATATWAVILPLISNGHGQNHVS